MGIEIQLKCTSTSTRFRFKYYFIHNRQIFPLIYCLTTRKTSESYLAIFQFIEEKVLKLEPAEFITDYEDGMRKAIKTHWPNVRVRGCWWHHKRAVHKKCVSFGMATLLRKNRNVRLVKNMLTNLPLLPEEKIHEGYGSVVEFAREKKLLNRFGRVFSYYEEYWLKQVRNNSLHCKEFVVSLCIFFEDLCRIGQ